MWVNSIRSTAQYNDHLLDEPAGAACKGKSEAHFAQPIQSWKSSQKLAHTFEMAIASSRPGGGVSNSSPSFNSLNWNQPEQKTKRWVLQHISLKFLNEIHWISVLTISQTTWKNFMMSIITSPTQPPRPTLFMKSFTPVPPSLETDARNSSLAYSGFICMPILQILPNNRKFYPFK